jgi:protein-S-isoprenylcysteine O-methyltransferase Ste14
VDRSGRNVLRDRLIRPPHGCCSFHDDAFPSIGPTTALDTHEAFLRSLFLIVCGAGLAGSAILRFKGVGTTVRPDRAASSLVIAGPYKITRNPMYLGLALVYLGITIADQSIWALILLPVVLIIIERGAIEPRRLFWNAGLGRYYPSYKADVRRWL